MQHTYKLRQNRDFLQLYRRGARIGSPWMMLYARPNGRRYNRLGITVGKKVGCAVRRNRARRIILAAYRMTEDLLPCGMDLVIVALPRIEGESSTTLQQFLAGAGAKKLRQIAAPRERGKGT